MRAFFNEAGLKALCETLAIRKIKTVGGFRDIVCLESDVKKLDQKPRFTTVMLHYGGWDREPGGGGEDEMNPLPDLTRLPKVSLPSLLVPMTSDISQIRIWIKRIVIHQ